MSLVNIDYGQTTNYSNQTTYSAGTNHTFTLNNLSSNTTYNYRITATDQAGNQTQTINRQFITKQLIITDTTSPTKITNLTLSNITQTAITLTWTAPGDNNNQGQAKSYDIRYSTNPITGSNWSSATQVSGAPTPQPAGQNETYTITGLSPDTTYHFAITTTDSSGSTSPISNEVSTTTSPTPPPPIILGCTDSSATNYSSTATADDGSCSYPTPSPSYTPPPTTGGGAPGATTRTGGSYYDTMPPSQPKDTQIQPADSQITLKWTNPKDPDFTRTIVIRKEGSAPTSRTDGTVIYDGINEEYTDINLDNAKTYYYSIYSYDKKPNYSKPATVKASPQAGKMSTKTISTTPQTTPKQTPTPPPLTGPFSLKMTSPQVKTLQQYLSSDNTIYPEAITSGYYGTLTTKAVQRFQCKYMNICSGTPSSNGYGLAGPKTREKIIQTMTGTSSAQTTIDTAKQALIQKIQEQINTLKAMVADLLKQLSEILKAKMAQR
jgi:chitodextrinase